MLSYSKAQGKLNRSKPKNERCPGSSAVLASAEVSLMHYQGNVC